MSTVVTDGVTTSASVCNSGEKEDLKNVKSY